MTSNAKLIDRGARHALHDFGSQSIVPAASSAAKAVFTACGAAKGWRSWALPSGKMMQVSAGLMAKLLDDHPDAPAEALYITVMRFPGSGNSIRWADAPMPVRAAYETFRSVYLHLWTLVRAHGAGMERSLPRRPPPQLVNSDMMETMRPENTGRLGSRETLSRKVVKLKPKAKAAKASAGHASGPAAKRAGTSAEALGDQK